MPSPESAIDVCKLALDYIAETANIASITETSETKEEICARWYDLTREGLLREYCWNFANTYFVLSRAGDGSGQYADKYNLPNDFIRLNSAGEDTRYPLTDYVMGPGYILGNNGTTFPIWYNTNIELVTKMDPLFINCLALALAVKIAFKITKKKSVVEYCSNLLAIELPKAIGVDGQEVPPRRIQRSKYLTARRMGGILGRDNRYYNFDDTF